jgi:hypothetical protein
MQSAHCAAYRVVPLSCCVPAVWRLKRRPLPLCSGFAGGGTAAVPAPAPWAAAEAAVAAAMAAAVAAAATKQEEAQHPPPFYLHRRSFVLFGIISYVQSYFVVSFNKQQLVNSIIFSISCSFVVYVLI